MITPRVFISPDSQYRYDHYLANDETIVKKITTMGLRSFWFGRYGLPADSVLPANGKGYTGWCAGHDLFEESGAPEFDIEISPGHTIRDLSS